MAMWAADGDMLARRVCACEGRGALRSRTNIIQGGAHRRSSSRQSSGDVICLAQRSQPVAPRRAAAPSAGPFRRARLPRQLPRRGGVRRRGRRQGLSGDAALPPVGAARRCAAPEPEPVPAPAPAPAPAPRRPPRAPRGASAARAPPRARRAAEERRRAAGAAPPRGARKGARARPQRTHIAGLWCLCVARIWSSARSPLPSAREQSPWYYSSAAEMRRRSEHNAPETPSFRRNAPTPCPDRDHDVAGTCQLMR